MMKTLITGSGGFCGKHLTRYLKDLGEEVHTLSRGGDPTPFHHSIEDITDIGTIASILKLIKPDTVFHLAGVSSASDPTLFYRVNTQYAVALLGALERIGHGNCPVLLVGTSAEYGNVTQDHLPIREDLPPCPYNHHGISKLAQTYVGLAAHASGYPVVIVRPFNVIGPGMPEHLVIQSFVSQIAKASEGKISPEIHVGNLKSSRDFVDVRDVVKIYWKLLNLPAAYGQVINVCSGKGTVIGDILSKLLQFAGVQAEIKIDPLRFRSIDVPVHYGSNEKLRELLGFAPDTDLDGTIKNILQEMNLNEENINRHCSGIQRRGTHSGVL